MLATNAALAERPVPEELCRPRPDGVPMLLVCGTPRSGTTMMLQLLANAFRLTYPDNIAARMWGAPHFGIAASRSMRDQVGAGSVGYESVAGISKDIFGPHDFAYFWERFFPFGENAFLTDEAMRRADTGRLLDELAAMWTVGGRAPLLFRGIIFTINADFFATLFSRALFIDMRRDPCDLALSMLKIRRERYGSEQVWWGSSPPERTALEGRRPEVQVAGQIHHLRRRIDAGLAKVAPERVVHLNYENACRDLPATLNTIAAAAAALGIELEAQPDRPIPPSFEPRRPDRSDPRWIDLSRLFAAYQSCPETACIDPD
ncbi:hypothetical protein A6A05_00560 [Magnetospirillum moscoviense]|uniref:Sulfotransferase n=1 Tax=Magnetospirillum moscoviense TaxID=1437059 RepID=A0A178MYI3_9PROT|nr:hypothetical protein A6A05_00560 [Magnetospirillum moscoviense]